MPAVPAVPGDPDVRPRRVVASRRPTLPTSGQSLQLKERKGAEMAEGQGLTVTLLMDMVMDDSARRRLDRRSDYPRTRTQSLHRPSSREMDESASHGSKRCRRLAELWTAVWHSAPKSVSSLPASTSSHRHHHWHGCSHRLKGAVVYGGKQDEHTGRLPLVDIVIGIEGRVLWLCALVTFLASFQQPGNAHTIVVVYTVVRTPGWRFV